MVNFKIDIKPSIKLLSLIFILHILTLIVIINYFPFNRMVLWIIIFCFSLFFSVYVNSQYYSKNISSISFINTNINVYFKNKFYDNVKLSKMIYVTNQLIIIKFIIENKKYNKLILPDMLNSKEEFTYLLLLLKWGNY